MAYDKIEQLYDALKQDGAVSKSREYFRSKMFAPGKEGYQNRVKLYNALKADGAIDSPTYEEFSKRLGMPDASFWFNDFVSGAARAIGSHNSSTGSNRNDGSNGKNGSNGK